MGPQKTHLYMQLYLPIAEVSVDAFLILGLGGIVGFLSGMFGVGGGFLITPLLFFIGVPPAVAVATGANQVVASSVSGVLAQMKRKAVDFRMGSVLLAGGIIGSAVGIWVFQLMTKAGQIDLFVQLSYVLFLGLIGAMMLQESLRSLLRSRNANAPIRRSHVHSWVHRLPLKMKFRASGLFISVIPPVLVGAVVGFLAAYSLAAFLGGRLSKLIHSSPEIGVIDRIVKEPVGGAHRDHMMAAASLGKAIDEELEALSAFTSKELRQQRRTKFLSMGA